MRGRTAWVVSCALFLSAPAFTQVFTTAVNIDAGLLRDSLGRLERQTGIELLYDGQLLRGLMAPAVRGRVTAEDVLRALLAETDLDFRRAASGAWIIERAATPLLEQQDAVLSEIMVVGRRTQNADIRRHENDIQPYVIAYKKDLLSADRDNLDQYVSSRITANTIVVPAYASQDGETLSSMDLRGLGEQNTLVLIDGRRMPSIPVTYTDFRQSDINAIPLHAVERMEVLTGTAGGIYGFGALGGVVNVVIDRDTDGLELHVNQGISSRGDGRRHGFELNYGRTLWNGTTDVSFVASWTQSDTVKAGARNYLLRDRRRIFEVAPELYSNLYPHENSITVISPYRIDLDTLEIEFNPNLVFKPEYGGATLASHQTFLPIGFSGDTEDLAAALARNAGEQDFSIPDDEALVDLGANPSTDAVMLNARRRLSRGTEVYVDLIALKSRGRSRGDVSNLTGGYGVLAPESPVNPFTEYVTVRFPVEAADFIASKHTSSTRSMLGLLMDLPGDWRGSVELAWGAFRRSAVVFSEYPVPVNLFFTGNPSDPVANPFGDWEEFSHAIRQERSSATFRNTMRSKMRNQSLRLARPVFRTAVGMATLSVLADRTIERVPQYEDSKSESTEGVTTTTETPVAARVRRTTSWHAEVNIPVADASSTVWPLRNMELQLALRHDKQENRFAPDPRETAPTYIDATFRGLTYSVGAKSAPTSWLTLRGSYATGKQPPRLTFLNEFEPQMTTIPYATDPKRGNMDLGAEGPFLLRSGGFSGMKSALASTLAFGAIVAPAGLEGPRLTIDVSSIRRKRDPLFRSGAEIMEHEEVWPERVERAPMTDQDRASNFSAGRVIMFDTRYSNEGMLKVQAIDLRVEWPFSVLGGHLNIYGDATYHRSTITAPFRDDERIEGHRGGPLKWRTNGGVSWSKGGLEVGANLQHFGSSHASDIGVVVDGEMFERYQGFLRVPSQTYLDAHATWRTSAYGGSLVEDLVLDVGIINILDTPPPRESHPFTARTPAYSRYGDPRQLRFELGLSVHF